MHASSVRWTLRPLPEHLSHMNWCVKGEWLNLCAFSFSHPSGQDRMEQCDEEFQFLRLVHSPS